MSNARENRMTAPTRDTHANWTTNNPVLPEGVLGIVKDRRYSGSVEYIVGDGVTAYSALKKFGDVHRADGKIDPDKLRPITFDPIHNAYRVLGERAGNAFQDGVKLK